MSKILKKEVGNRTMKWSLRRGRIGLASVVIASGGFFLLGQTNSVKADENQPMSDNTVVLADSLYIANDATPEEMMSEVMAPSQPEEMMETVQPATEPTVPSEVQPVTTDMMAENTVTTPEASEMPVDMLEASSASENTDKVINSLDQAIKSEISVPDKYVKAANFPGPFTAGVNQVIPYEAFGGDGMLTRLLLKTSDGAPWSENGTAMNPALLPLQDLEKGNFFYSLDLDGDLKGNMDGELLQGLKNLPAGKVTATLNLYGAKNGKADTMNPIASKVVTLNFSPEHQEQDLKAALMNNLKNEITVPAKYTEKANFPGPFTAGVNQVIPFEAFGGDGMLTRLLLKTSDGSPWSDNGTAMNPALLPVDGLETGQYFYQVVLGNQLDGKMDGELLQALKAMPGQSLMGKVLVYAAKDGKADLNKVVASQDVTITLEKTMPMNQNDMSQEMKKDMDTDSHKGMGPKTSNPSQQQMDMMTPKKHMQSEQSSPAMSKITNKVKSAKGDMKAMPQAVKEMSKEGLPKTGESNHKVWGALGIFSLFAAMGLAFKSLLYKKKQ